MLPWTRFEILWAVRLMAAALPGLDPADARATLATYCRATDPFANVGLRAAVWALSALALLSTGRPLGSLSPARADALVQRWYGSRLYLLRQMVTIVKMVACFTRYGPT